MLDSQSHMHRQLKILSQIDRRRRYRSWAQAFQIGMLIFFADQIVKTYCAGRLLESDQQPILGQSILQLARVPDAGAFGNLARILPRGWSSFPGYLAIGLWLTVSLMLLFRLGQAKFGELMAFVLVLTGGMSNLVSRNFTTQSFDTFVVQIGVQQFFAFSIADFSVLIGSFFLIRGYLLRLSFGWMRVSRSSL